MLCCRYPWADPAEVEDIMTAARAMFPATGYTRFNTNVMGRTRVIYKWLGRQLMEVQYRLGANIQTQITPCQNYLSDIVAEISMHQGVPPGQIAYVTGVFFAGMKCLEGCANMTMLAAFTDNFQRAVDIYLVSRFEYPAE